MRLVRAGYRDESTRSGTTGTGIRTGGKAKLKFRNQPPQLRGYGPRISEPATRQAPGQSLHPPGPRRKISCRSSGKHKFVLFNA